jgi:serine/threonine protein kinase
MALASGTRLGPYEIMSPLGAGGMGEVYRARDLRLERDVAIKVLPANPSSDSSLKQRLEREGKAVSKLSHPHICGLYDIGHQEGVDFLVMEYLEGETLEQRLLKDPLPTDQALRYAVQIADALAKAHKLGIIHRDLKPANVMLTKSGAKLMDFGLAKQSVCVPLNAALAEMTAAQTKLTEEGMIVGTFQYMAPEQLEGKDADTRTDIFAFGELTYEMVTGKPAFLAKSRASLIAAILTTEPPPMTELQPVAPVALEHVVRKCLAKDPDERWQSASDLAGELTWIAQSRSQASAPAAVAPSRSHSPFLWSVGLLAALCALALGALYLRTSPPLESRAVCSTILPPEKATFAFLGENGSAALSPDGRSLAFIARTESGAQIFVRSLDSYNARPLPGTEEATQIFWSPDSRHLGFFAQNKLKRVPAAGGPAVTVCALDTGPRGGSWNRQDVIIFGAWPGEIYRVPASGGTPEKATHFDPARQDSTQRWPHFLPDGNHFLYMSSAFGSFNEDNVFYLGSLDGKVNRILFHGSSNIAYASGYLLYVVDKNLMARPFDPTKLDFTGDAVSVAEGVQYDTLFSEAVFSVSSNGVLSYQTGNASSARTMTLFDGTGKQAGSLSDPAPYYGPQFSPDGKRLAYHLIDPRTGKADIWIQDVASGSRTRLTVDAVRSLWPVWSRNGAEVAYVSTRSGKPVIYVKGANGMALEQKIWEPAIAARATDWTPDSKALILQERASTMKWRLALFPLGAKGAPEPLVEVPGANVTAARLSPDGRWIAYESDESGKDEIYVSPFPKPDGRLQISVAGGIEPRWRRDGRELFYFAPDGKLMAAALSEKNGLLDAVSVRALYQTKAVPGTNDSYDVTPDGSRFLVNIIATEETPTPLSLVENWTAELKK